MKEFEHPPDELTPEEIKAIKEQVEKDLGWVEPQGKE